MPTYEYECPHCRYTFEIFQKITDKPLEECPKCNNKVKRLIGSGAGFIFKGPGFYATDYAKSKSKKPDSPEKDTAPCVNKDNKPECKSCRVNK
jgi:putative FmdB family regulatory protein